MDARQHQNRKDIFGPDLGLVGPNLVHNIFLKVSGLLDVRHCTKLLYCAISRKTEKSKKPKFRPNFASTPNFFHELYHFPMPFKVKVMNQLEKTAKNLISGPILACLAQMWFHEICFVDFTSHSSQTLFQAIVICNFQEN